MVNTKKHQGLQVASWMFLVGILLGILILEGNILPQYMYLIAYFFILIEQEMLLLQYRNIQDRINLQAPKVRTKCNIFLMDMIGNLLVVSVLCWLRKFHLGIWLGQR